MRNSLAAHSVTSAQCWALWLLRQGLRVAPPHRSWLRSKERATSRAQILRRADYGLTTCRVQATEALRRAKFKFAGRQKIIESNNWGFTKFHSQDYIDWKKQGRIVNCGVHAEV